MIKVGKWIAKHKILIIIIGIALLIPSYLGMAATRINYDVLSYLPDTLETVEGQDIMVDQFGMGAFSMIVVEDMELKDVAALKEKIEAVDHVKKVLWYDSVLDVSVPVEMLPKDLREAFFNGDATMMIALFDNTTSSETSMEAVTQIRKITSKNCFVSGMTGIVTDIKQIALKEMPIYVVIASCLSLIVLLLAMDSLVVPVLFLLCIGVAVLYNLGSNIFLGQISYITKALTAVLQLGVTMDYSIFLLNSYEENKKRFEGDKERAMAHAINATFKSVIGSSITTVAGFIALCFMTFTLGLDLGIVMAKGVILGVISCVTVLPSLILVLDKPLEKTMHKSLIPSTKKLATGLVKIFPVFLVMFAALIYPFYSAYSQTNNEIYYDLSESLPEDMANVIANTKLKDEFGVGTTHMVLVDSSLSAKDARNMTNELEKVDGVKYVLGLESVVGSLVPEEVLPDSITSVLKNDKWELMLINSEYKTATDPMAKQIDELNKIITKYDKNGLLIGEAACTNDLVNITTVDFQVVNAISIVAIFIIIAIVEKSITLPIILVAVIELAIFINLGIPHLMGESLPFITPICISTIQLGATVDYAILMTTRYKKERYLGNDKRTSVITALETSIPSIIVSAMGLFAATIGVAFYSDVDLISSICKLLARGAVISMFCVTLILPAMFMLFDKVIAKTTLGFKPKKTSISEAAV